MKLKLFYGKTFPCVCHAIWNLYKRKMGNACLLSNVEFEKCPEFEGALRVEFLDGTTSHMKNKKVPSTDANFATILDYKCNMQFYYQCVPELEKTQSIKKLQQEVDLQNLYDEMVELMETSFYAGDIIFKFEYLDIYLQTNTYFHGDRLTIIDIFMYYTLFFYFNPKSFYYFRCKELFKNVLRWFKMMSGILNFPEETALQSYLREIEEGIVKMPMEPKEDELELPLNLIVSMRKLENRERNQKEEDMYIQKMNEYQILMQRIKQGLESEEKWNQLVDQRRSNKPQEETKPSANSYEGKLVDAEHGKVVTRFPPEPSGFLHIGHAKAAILNSYYANYYNGKMLLRFDDTNPVLEDIKYEESIIEDLEKLGIKYEKISYTSQYFDKLEEFCIQLIKMGKAYADDTEIEEMRYQRGEGIESKNRNMSVEECLKIFDEMRKGSDIGVKYCIRARIDMQSKNKCMRDPVLYRCIIDVPHHKHQFKYKCYPTYDFACPIIDSIEGITHALRTNEYSDRIEQYHWVIDALQLRKVHIYEFSRIAFVKTVMSKRKLKWFVENKIVEDWDDPRMPTIKGIMRRGLTKEALFKFIIDQGPSKAGNLMQWDKLWATNKQIIDPVIPRFTVLNTDCVCLTLTDLTNEVKEKVRALHMKNVDLGGCKMYYLNKFLIEREDAIGLKEEEEITLTKLGNIGIKKIITKGDTLEIEGFSNFMGDFKKTKKKIHWLPNLPDKLSKVILYEYDHLITVEKFDTADKEDWRKYINPESKFETQAVGDTEMYRVNVGDRVQFERRGYYILDKIENHVYHFIKIPDGKAKNMSIISTKVDAQNLAGTKTKE